MTGNDVILSSEISTQDTSISSLGMERLKSCLVGTDCSLMFFAGNGASSAGHTSILCTLSLLYHLLFDALACSGIFDLKYCEFPTVLEKIRSDLVRVLKYNNQIRGAVQGYTVNNEINLMWSIDFIYFLGVGLIEQMFLQAVPFRNIETALNPYQIPKGNLPHVYQTFRRFL